MLPLLTRHPVDWESFFSILLELRYAVASHLEPWLEHRIVGIGAMDLGWCPKEDSAQCLQFRSSEFRRNLRRYRTSPRTSFPVVTGNLETPIGSSFKCIGLAKSR